MDGTWEKILDGLRAGCDETEGEDWTVSVDSTVVRCPSACRRSPPPAACRLPVKGDGVDHEAVKAREALGRSRGGLSTKVHLVADRRCRPIARIISPGQHGDSPYFRRVGVCWRMCASSAGGWAVLVSVPGLVLADKAYSSRANRAYLRRRGIEAVIPIKRDQQANRLEQGSKGGRPSGFDAERYKERNTAERCINKMKSYRAVALRTDKRERIYQGTVDVASIRIWLRDPVQ